MHAAWKHAGTLASASVLAGCASNNYDFARVPGGPDRVSRLVGDLQSSDGDDDALYEFSLVPLVHSHLHVFEEADEEDSPAEFVEADIETSLPLFGFVDGTVTQYGTDKRLLTRDEFDSSFWGAFGTHREFVATTAGVREKTRHTFLWLFKWSGEETWHPAQTLAVSDE